MVDSKYKGECALTYSSRFNIGNSVETTQPLVFLDHVFSRVVSHVHLLLFVPLFGSVGLQQNLHWTFLGAGGGGRDGGVLHTKLLDSPILTHGLAQVVYFRNGAQNGLDRLGGRDLATLGTGANDAWLDLCGAPHGLHDLA